MSMAPQSPGTNDSENLVQRWNFSVILTLLSWIVRDSLQDLHVDSSILEGRRKDCSLFPNQNG